MPKSPTVKSTIGNDPFAALIPVPQEDIEAPAFVPKPKKPMKVSENRDTPRKEPVEPKPIPPERKKQKLTIHLDGELADRVKNAAYWCPRLTIAGIAEVGIRTAIEKLEREHGSRYPAREGDLIGGRPIK